MESTPPNIEEKTTINPEERTMGMLCHLLALCAFLIPLGNIIGPLVIWLIKKDQMPFVNDQGKESLNFQITATIILTAALCISWILIFILIGFLLLPLVAIAGLFVFIYAVVGAIKASEGIAYRYPFSIKFIK